MPAWEDDGWLDGDAGRMIRPYAVANGRTRPRVRFDLLSMVMATGSGTTRALEPDHRHILGLCQQPVSVAEIAARARLPAMVAKVLLSDLVDSGAVRAAAPGGDAEVPERILLERLLDGLQRRAT